MSPALRGAALALALVLLCACAPREAAPAQGTAPAEAAPVQETVQAPLSPKAQARADLLRHSERMVLDTLAFRRVPQSDPVDPAWFDDAAFVGDSVSVMLEYYNNAYHTLGHPAFFCAENLSPRNAMHAEAGSQRLPEWPKGSGEHPTLPEGIAACGAKKVYLMLGMNSISGGVDNAAADLVTLVESILQASPEAVIFIQPTTPMIATSPRADDRLNNGTIRAYDLALSRICQERGWYYVDVARALMNENGALRGDYSGDQAMGIHLNFTGAAAWAEYLLTHVPEELK